MKEDHIKKCPSCNKMIGRSWLVCGPCEDREKRRQLAIDNGVQFRKGKVLTPEHRANIARANREKANARKRN